MNSTSAILGSRAGRTLPVAAEKIGAGAQTGFLFSRTLFLMLLTFRFSRTLIGSRILKILRHFACLWPARLVATRRRLEKPNERLNTQMTIS